jgi:hypothetical protein
MGEEFLNGVDMTSSVGDLNSISQTSDFNKDILDTDFLNKDEVIDIGEGVERKGIEGDMFLMRKSRDLGYKFESVVDNEKVSGNGNRERVRSSSGGEKVHTY